MIGASSAVIDKVPEGVGILTTPEEAKQFVDATKVDVLAPAVGTCTGCSKAWFTATFRSG